MEYIRNTLKQLLRAGGGWLHICWILLSVSGHYLRWRIQFRLRYHLIVKESTQNFMKQTLLIVRHGQTTWNIEHRLPGQLPGVALNETGRQQAARLADALTVLPISAIISSPLERAYDTAEYIAKERKIEIQLEPELMDTDIGFWAGQKIEELARVDPAWNAYVKDPTVAPEGVETFPQVQARVVAAVERWRAQEQSGAYPVFVAHADVVKLLVAHYTGLDPARAGSLQIENASVSLIELQEEQRPHVVAIGWSPRPGWLQVPTAENVQRPPDQTQEAGEQKM